MGQYFLIVNLDREEYLHPHKFGDGLKLFEFGFGGLTMAGLTTLLTHEADGYFDQPSELLGAWAGQRVVFAGDEADAGGNYLSDDQLRRLRDAIAAQPGGFSPRLPNSVHLFAEFCCRDISEPLLLAMCHCDWLREDIEEAVRKERFLRPEAYRERVRRELERTASGEAE